MGLVFNSGHVILIDGAVGNYEVRIRVLVADLHKGILIVGAMSEHQVISALRIVFGRFENVRRRGDLDIAEFRAILLRRVLRRVVSERAPAAVIDRSRQKHRYLEYLLGRFRGCSFLGGLRLGALLRFRVVRRLLRRAAQHAYKHQNTGQTYDNFLESPFHKFYSSHHSTRC
ncbi:hypothetical protein SDC9_154322 [bioreactor metagenome]|uniref:Uncharacterized protein n=1 Tax=bioreactor metagenome TaxID=1076179 RepID=A0A645F328_9ZZZZ